MSHRTRVKICGLTRSTDVEAACAVGADAIGLVFYPPSPRYVTPRQAGQLRRLLPAFVDCVALFVNPEQEQVKEVLRLVQPELIQFHGDESPEFCNSFGHRYLRAFRVGGPGMDTPEAVLEACLQYPDAAAWLFDSYSSGYGGSGLSFDASLLSGVQASAGRRPLVFAGGLEAQTVAATIAHHQPWAVDVSSGVEEAPGVKSAKRMAQFMRAVAGQG